MRQEAEAHRAEDEKKKELVEARNRAEQLVYLSEKTLKEAGDKAKPEDKREVEDAITALKGVMHQDNLEEIKSKSDKLSEVIQKVGTQMYESAKEESESDQQAANSNQEKKDKDNEGTENKTPDAK